MTTTEPIVGLSITAAAVEQTEQPATYGRHQLRMGMYSFIYFSPEVARQWVSVLEPIAKEND